MAKTPNSRQQLRALAPKPTTGSDASSLSSPPKSSSRLPIFDDLTAVIPVMMPNEPYRSLAERVDSPNRQMTIEQLVDTRLCVSALTPQQCREVLMQLDDQQIKNAVYDRTLCFPSDQWTQNIRAIYGWQVQQDTQVISSFENMTLHMQGLFNTWQNIHYFTNGDYDNIEAHIKSYVCPSIDNIGVYGAYSKHTTTKINAIAALIKIGSIIVGIPILTSERGVAMFEYDPLSRAVGNILSSATTEATRREIFSPELEGEFLDIAKRANLAGLFTGLNHALAPGAKVCPYTVPRGDLLIPYGSLEAPASRSQPAPMAKRRKLTAGGHAAGQPVPAKEETATPGSSRASSIQPRGVTEGMVTSPSTPLNPFSRPSSAGPVAMPPFAKAAYSTAASMVKNEDVHIEKEQPQQGEQASNQISEPQGMAEGAEEHQSESQGEKQAANGAEGQDKQADGSPKSYAPGSEGLGLPTEVQPDKEGTTELQTEKTEQTEQTEQTEHNEQDTRATAYDEMLRRIQEEVFHPRTEETPEQQLRRAPAVTGMIQHTASSILKQFQAAASDCEDGGRRDLFMVSLQDTAFALLWILESCAINTCGTALSAEVSRTVSRNALVGALWATVRLGSGAECLQLLNVKDHMGTETFAEKLERIIQKLSETGVVGFNGLHLILSNMRSGIDYRTPVSSDC